jgi:hypothetical protein
MARYSQPLNHCLKNSSLLASAAHSNTKRLAWRKVLTWLALAALLGPALAPAQDATSGMLSGWFADLAAIKRKAEAGDADAQVSQGNALAAHSRSRDALAAPSLD